VALAAVLKSGRRHAEPAEEVRAGKPAIVAMLSPTVAKTMLS
jgi:hypothetical protein